MALNKSNLEIFVEAYLKQHKRNTIGKRFIQKAIALIDMKLDNPCCEDYDGDPIDLRTPRDNQFTKTIELYLRSITKRGHIRSLTRTRALLDRYLTCCGAVEVE